MKKATKGKKLDFTIADVNEVYEGPVGILWEMLMGEQIHVGGAEETNLLAEKAGVKKGSIILDVCSALGGPARYLANKYQCKIIGLDATQKMINEAIRRTAQAGLSNLISYKLGNALDMPFKANTFDIVWGQDAWCYITDKERLIKEAHRVLKKRGIIAFTDWIQVGKMTANEWNALNSFMAFPYMESLNGYESLLKNKGFKILHKDDLSKSFRIHCRFYQKTLRNELRNDIVNKFGLEMFQIADKGLAKWVKAADEGKVGLSRLIGKKLI